MERQRVLIAGGTGAVGRRLVPALAAAGHDVHVLTRSRESGALAERLGARPVDGDLLDARTVTAAVRTLRPTVLMHLATGFAGSCSLPDAYALTNRLRIDGSRNLVAAAERSHAQRVVAQSIAFAYRPQGPEVVDEQAPLDVAARDAAWRSAVDAVARLEETTLDAQQAVAVVLRFGAFYGPGTAYAADGPVGRAVLARRLPVPGRGRGLTSFVHVDDAAAAALRAVDSGWGVYNVTDDTPARAADWIPALARRYGAPAPRRVPAWLVRVRAGDHAVASMTSGRGAANCRARKELGWVPSRPDWRVAFSTDQGW